jgi:hypothetical protein
MLFTAHREMLPALTEHTYIRAVNSVTVLRSSLSSETFVSSPRSHQLEHLVAYPVARVTNAF